MSKMNNASPKLAINPRENRPLANPSVCEYQPSVCSCNPVNIPFVGKNIPNTIFQMGTRGALGFSVVELVVTMAVALTLIALSGPTFRTLTQNNRMAAQVNDLIADINYARSEAIKRRTNITVCISTDGATCTGLNWRAGRVVMAGGTVLRVRGPLGGSGDTLTSTVPNPLIFDLRGAIPVGGSFTFCDDRGATFGRLLTLNNIGQVTLNRATPPVATCL